MRHTRCQLPRIRWSPLAPLALATALGCSAGETPTESSGPPDLSRSTAAAYTFVDLGALGACCSGAADVNDHDQVVGFSEVPFRDDGGPGEDRGTHAFLWENGVLRDLDVGDFSGAAAINNSGTIVFSIGRFDEGAAFLWNDGVVTQLQGLSTHDAAADINARGQVTGSSATHNFVAQYAVRWDKSGALTTLGTFGTGSGGDGGRAINAGGQVAGVSGAHAALWSRGGITDLGTLGGQFSFANGINARGTVVGCSGLSGVFWFHGFVWDRSGMRDLGTLGGQASCANDIDDAGRIVGEAETASGGTHAVIWDHGVVTDLGVLAGGFGSGAVAINSKGTVVGYYYWSTSETHAAMWIRR
jgi:probable HAF family extracellular repeat protein